MKKLQVLLEDDYEDFVSLENVEKSSYVLGSELWDGKFSQNGMSGQKGKVHLGPNVSSSTHNRGCVVNGSSAMAAI